MPITYNHTTPNKTQLLALYTDAEWTAYIKDPDKLVRAFENSLDVICAWDGDILVGIIRSVGDGETILYIQDILVLKAYKRNGIGTILVNKLLEQYTDVRQIVLLTDDTPDTREFYTALGFTAADDGKLVGFCRVR